MLATLFGCSPDLELLPMGISNIEANVRDVDLRLGNAGKRLFKRRKSRFEFAGARLSA
jgi:hypothetical protein